MITAHFLVRYRLRVDWVAECRDLRAYGGEMGEIRIESNTMPRHMTNLDL